jgi:hypothetical protein
MALDVFGEIVIDALKWPPVTNGAALVIAPIASPIRDLAAYLASRGCSAPIATSPRVGSCTYCELPSGTQRRSHMSSRLQLDIVF